MAKKKYSKSVFRTPDGEIIESCYCRRCRRTLSPRQFYEATDKLLDTNGYMSVCKDCISDIYSSNFKIEPTLERAILKTCRTFNVAYVPSALEATRTWIENRIEEDVSTENAFGFYKSKVAVFARLNPSQQTHFNEPSPDMLPNDEELEEEYYDLAEFWGNGLSPEDYEFLETQLGNFKKTHKSDTYSELVLLKEVCFVLLDIQKARQQNKSTTSHVKALQDIMKSLAISPNVANASNANKSMEAFGSWIKDIEELTPAEWYEDKEIYKDVDNLGQYFEDYFVRPIKNFITGSRDFNITEQDGEIDISFNEVEYVDDEED